MFFIEHQIIIFVTKRIRLNFLLRPSDLKSDFTLTLGYLNLALNNPAQLVRESDSRQADRHLVSRSVSWSVSQLVSQLVRQHTSRHTDRVSVSYQVS